MPELPEVETVRLGLLPYLKNKTIKYVEVLYPKHSHLSEIKNQKILDIKRKGKYLIFCLEDYYLISHLRMEGKYFINESIDSLKKHDLVKFYLDDDILIYNDVRRFGVFYLLNKDSDIYNIYPLNKVGSEPFDIKDEELLKKLEGRKDKIKTALLDQSVISGLGNIYVDEVLFLSKINPNRLSSSINKDEVKSIITSSIEVLNKAIKEGGSTIKSFTAFNGEVGHFQNSLKVHGKDDLRCDVCLNYIERIKIGGRSTYYCPTCQKLNKDQKIYGITGGFSSGKTTVINILKKLDESTYSTDAIYKELFDSSNELRREIKKHFKTLDRIKLSKIIFNSKIENEKLKEITHKYILRELFLRIEKDNSKRIFVEVPLLFEGSYNKLFDKTITVLESDEVHQRILKSKNFSIEEDELRNKSQISKLEKSKMSDLILYNNSSISNLEKEVKKLIKELC